MKSLNSEKVNLIKNILSYNPKGLTISDVSSKIKINRNQTAKYLELLRVAGLIEMKHCGPSKVYFISHRVPLSSILEFSSDYIICFDSNFDIIQVNDQMTNLLKEKRENLIGDNLRNIYPPFLELLPDDELDFCLKKSKEKIKENSVIIDNISLRFQVRLIPTMLDDGNRGLACIIKDITTQYQTEQEKEKILQQINFISWKLKELRELPHDADIYGAIVTGIDKIIPNTIIIVNVYNPESDNFILKGMNGLNTENIIEKYFNMEFSLNTSPLYQNVINILKKGEFFQCPPELLPELIKQISPEIINKLKNDFNLSNLYLIGLSWQKKLLGNVAFITHKDTICFQTQFIENYAKTASIALQRNLAEQKIKSIRREKKIQDTTRIINLLPIPGLLIDNKGKILSWNREIEDLTGISTDSVINTNLDEILTQFFGKRKNRLIHGLLDPKIDVNNYYDHVEYEEDTINAEEYLIDIKGKERVLKAKVIPVYDYDKQISGIVELFIDITKERKLDLKLLDENQKLMNIINYHPDPTFVIDNQGKILSWNKAIEELTGTKYESIINEGRYNYALPFYGEQSPILIDLIFHNENKIKKRYNYVKKNGNTYTAEVVLKNLGKRKNVYLSIVASPFYDKDGKYIGSIESIRDITSIKLLELRLNNRFEELGHSYKEIRAKLDEISIREKNHAKNEEIFRTLIDTYPDGIIIHYKGQIYFINNKATTILGYDNSQELRGYSILNIVHPDKREMFSQKFYVSNTSYPTFEYDVFLKKDNTEFPVEITGFYIMVDKLKIDIIIFRDFSEDNNRSVFLKQEGKKLDILSSITRHDIANQIQILQSTLYLLSEEKISETGVILLKKAFIPCKNILESIKSTDNYQVIDNQHPNWFSVKKLAYDAIHRHQITDDVFSFSGENVEILADPMIKMVFENLVENSIRHGESNNKFFFITNILSKECQVIYGDCGVGIPDNEKEIIFVKGYGKNTGLGLSLIRDILSITGITIRESGKFGKGVRFEITIPYGKWKKCK